MSGAAGSLLALPPPAFWTTVGALAGAAFALRAWPHAGRRPIGLDTWYYLAYAAALRRRPGFDVRLPQYLLQDERQSYPPLLPMLLALLPASWLRRRFWAIGPAFDAAHVALLQWLTWQATRDLAVSVLAAGCLAFGSQAVVEARALSTRGLGALLHSAAVLVAIESASRPGHTGWLAAAVGAGVVLLLASAAMSAAYAIVLSIFAIVFRDDAYLQIGGAALLAAVVVSKGHYLRVGLNYLHAVRFWLRFHRLFGAHPIRDSPVYGTAPPRDRSLRPTAGLLGQGLTDQVLRLVGDNPYVLALLPAADAWLLSPLRAWALGLAGLALLATLTSTLRGFGLGRTWMKAAVFPTAYALALEIGASEARLLGPVGIMTLACLGLGLAALGVQYAHARRAGATDAEPLPGLDQAVSCLSSLPPGGVLCLPYVHAGYVSFHSGKPVLWGGHCGDLGRLAALSPVISEPLPELMQKYGARYLLLDRDYCAPRDVGLDAGADMKGAWGRCALYEWSPRAAQA